MTLCGENLLAIFVPRPAGLPAVFALYQGLCPPLWALSSHPTDESLSVGAPAWASIRGPYGAGRGSVVS